MLVLSVLTGFELTISKQLFKLDSLFKVQSVVAFPAPSEFFSSFWIGLASKTQRKGGAKYQLNDENNS